MLGVVIVTHGNLAQEFVHAAEHVVGPQRQLVPICIAPDEDMKDCNTRIEKAAVSADTGEGVVILTDMFGGTPCNLSMNAMERGEREVIAGVNLPMLIKLLTVRGVMPIDEAALEAQESGRKYINIASNLLKRK